MDRKQYNATYENEDSHWWFLAKRKFIQSVIPKQNKKLEILDIGCGTGGITKFLKLWGNVTGIEPSKVAQSYLQKRNIKFFPDSIENFSSHIKYDLVCLLDVLYHKNIKSDKKVIIKSASLLKQKGLILITDCSVKWLFGPHDIEMHARKRYDLSELLYLVRISGFTIKKATYVYFLVFPFIILSRLSQKIYYRSNISRVNKLINHFLLSLCAFESNFLRFYNYPIGSSILILAEKK